MQIDICKFPAHCIGQPKCGAVWPLGVTTIHPPMPGRLLAAPDWVQPGAWGCWRAHLRQWEDMLAAGEPWRVILEADAVTREGREELTTRLWAHINTAMDTGADLIYFGGQVLPGTRQPEPITGTVWHGYGINRTHAYMVRNTQRTLAAYHRLCTMQQAVNGKRHVDWVLGDLQNTGELLATIPDRWFFGQAAGISGTNGDKRREKWWDWK